jgi:rhodanese-related sulfurtransferase
MCRENSENAAMKAERTLKDNLYEQVARMAKAMASPKRLELIELLCQAPKSVDLLAREAGISIKLTSAHLKALRGARVVETERQGKNIIYRIASPEIPRFWVLLRSLAQDRLFELQDALRSLTASGDEWHGENRDALLRKAKDGEVVVIDVRPPTEYQQSHFPHARSMPLDELRARLAELPRDKPIVAYCRGPYCLMSADAVRFLKEQGYAAQQLREGVADWDLVQAA